VPFPLDFQLSSAGYNAVTCMYLIQKTEDIILVVKGHLAKNVWQMQGNTMGE